jgi:hypothetical protein
VHYLLGEVVVASFDGIGEAPVLLSVEVGENTVLVRESTIVSVYAVLSEIEMV